MKAIALDALITEAQKKALKELGHGLTGDALITEAFSLLYDKYDVIDKAEYKNRMYYLVTPRKKNVRTKSTTDNAK